MKELLVIMASAMPVEEHLKQLKKAIEVWESNPTEQNLQSVELSSMLFGTKRSLKDNDPMSFINELNKTQRAKDLLTPKEN